MGRKKKDPATNPFISTNGTIQTSSENYIENVFETKKLDGSVLKKSHFSDIDFVTGLSLSDKHIMPLLNKNTTHCTLLILLFILCNINENETQIKLDTNELENLLGYKTSMINTSKKELEKMDLIAKQSGRGTKYLYWINPFVFFRGKRIDFLLKICPQRTNRIKINVIKT